jgi:hypothetical protein
MSLIIAYLTFMIAAMVFGRRIYRKKRRAKNRRSELKKREAKRARAHEFVPMPSRKVNAYKKNYIIQRSCLEKKNLTEDRANDLVDKILREEGRLIYYYKCEFCSSFHLTKKVPNSSYSKRLHIG